MNTNSLKRTGIGIIAAGAFLYGGGAGLCVYRDSHDREEISKRVPALRTVDDLDARLNELLKESVDNRSGRKLLERYTTDPSFARDFNALSSEYSALLARDDIRDARNQIHDANNRHVYRLILSGVSGIASFIFGYTLLNRARKRKTLTL